MKITINERVKHRIIGLAVILSLVAIFAPAIMKKSLRSFDDNLNISVVLPPKPATPNVSILEEKALFKTTKLARVEIPPVPKINSTASLDKAESIVPNNNLVSLPAIPAMGKQELKQSPSNSFPESKKKRIAQAPVVDLSHPEANEVTHQSLPIKSAKNDYVVQLGTFSQLENAEALVSKLHRKGYKANYSKVLIHEKVYYKVLVGQATVKEEAKNLQKQLADAVQINGIVVLNKVS